MGFDCSEIEGMLGGTIVFGDGTQEFTDIFEFDFDTICYYSPVVLFRNRLGGSVIVSQVTERNTFLPGIRQIFHIHSVEL